jgi:plasmid stabilization system protein ParE
VPKVRWTDEALSDLRGILQYVDERNPFAAIDLVETIIASGNALAAFAARNPIRYPAQLRERPVLGTRYLLLYPFVTARGRDCAERSIGRKSA